MPGFECCYRHKVTLAFGATDTAKYFVIPFTGELKQLDVVLPNFSGASSAVVSILDSDGFTYYASTSLTKNQTHNLTPNQWIPRNDTSILKVTLNTQAGGTGGNVTVICRFKGEL